MEYFLERYFLALPLNSLFLFVVELYHEQEVRRDCRQHARFLAQKRRR